MEDKSQEAEEPEKEEVEEEEYPALGTNATSAGPDSARKGRIGEKPDDEDGASKDEEEDTEARIKKASRDRLHFPALEPEEQADFLSKKAKQLKEQAEEMKETAA